MFNKVFGKLGGGSKRKTAGTTSTATRSRSSTRAATPATSGRKPAGGSRAQSVAARHIASAAATSSGARRSSTRPRPTRQQKNVRHVGGANGRARHRGEKPELLVCYLCGEQFGTASLAIHQPQCYEKQLAWWQKTDPSVRGPKPKDPAVHGHHTQKDLSPEQIHRLNQKNEKKHDQHMPACPNCGRTFLPDRLAVHKRACRPGAAGSAKPVGSSRKPARRSASAAGGMRRTPARAAPRRNCRVY